MNDVDQVSTSKPAAPKISLTVGLITAAVAFGLSLGLGRYLARAPAPAVVSKPAATAIVYKIPVSSSQVSLGPADALVTLVQWCDLPDPACANAEPAVQALLERYPNDLRLVFRHHVTAARADSSSAHQYARIAHEQAGKFWQAREQLLSHRGEVTRIDLERYATELGMNPTAVNRALDAGTYSGHVAADRIFAEMFEVKSTPAFFANGHPLRGEASERALEDLIKAEMVRAKQLVDRGTPKTELYAELTKNGVWNPPVRPRPAQ